MVAKRRRERKGEKEIRILLVFSLSIQGLETREDAVLEVVVEGVRRSLGLRDERSQRLASYLCRNIRLMNIRLLS